MAFTHLHVHTEYSLLDGSGKIKEMVAQAKALGCDSLAITDHGAMYGVIDFYRAAKEAGIKPIIGCEIYVTNGSRFDREISQGDDRYYHLVLLAENNQGYSNLMKIVSTGFTEGFYYKPRVDYETLEKYSGGLIASSACLAGIIPKLLLRGRYEDAVEEALRLQNLFGRGNFFLELQDHGMPEQRTVNSQLLRMSEEYKIPLIATNDVHYTYDTDWEAHDILLCIQTGKKVHDQDRMRYEGGQYYLKSPEEMQELFRYAPEAIQNTELIAKRCNVEIEFGVQKLPQYDVPAGYTAEEYLTKLCEEGLRRRYENYQDYEDRLHFELETIKQMGYVDYFLIVWDFINYAKQNHIMVGPGRGSAAGSLVSYALAITDIDPIRYNLLFERFLNPERVSMPDIDVDFCYERRGEVIDYVTQKYGKDKVVQIITFGTMAARNVIRDVGRVLDMPYGAVDQIAKMIPAELNITIDKALQENSEFKRAYETDTQIRNLIDMAKRLEGLPRHSSMHAAGVVISKEPIMEYVPLSRGSDGSIVTQYVMTTLEELGLLKMDFLGLRTLTVIQDALEMIKTNIGLSIDLNEIDYNDINVLEMIGAGKTEGVFQLESAGMKSFMRELRPQTLEDIIAGIALYRPGPMDFIPKYIAGKNSGKEIVYDCPQLKPILEPTYGCIVYQEQVMQIVRDLAGYSLGGADILRRAMSKKKDSVMQAERKRFVYGDEKTGVAGCIKNGISEQVANKIYDDMVDFAKYAFNKSHAAAYAIVCYQTAYLKFYFPVEFMAALMTSVMDRLTKLGEYIQECKGLSIDILPPDINEAESTFAARGKNIRYGLSAIKGVGRNVIDAIVEERKENGPYQDIYDFCQRLALKDINKRTVENLIKAGAFDSLGFTRKQLIHIYMDVMDKVASDKKSDISGQLSFFDIAEEETRAAFMIRVPDVGEFDQEVLLEFEKEVLGIYLSGHPLDAYSEILKKNTTARTIDFLRDEEGRVIVHDQSMATIGGIIAKVTNKSARNGKQMAFLTLEDLFGTVEVIVFPADYVLNRPLIVEGKRVLIKGKVTIDSDADGKLIAERIIDLEETGKELWIQFQNRADYEKHERYINSLNTVDELRGQTPIRLYLKEEKQIRKMPASYNINLDEDFLSVLKGRFGEENVKVTAAKKV
ncbi:MAG: DNA polymerase III subunit alpha [Lachnospiraceae bacterium]|nr:DNA polymerase III subunit alpha [Lachnospiraceae bacterium]